MHILIHAPTDDSNWGIGHQAPELASSVVQSSPRKMELLGYDGFSYNNRESQGIWLYASHFQDECSGQ